MAKTPKPKKAQPPSLHSRAARRQIESTPPPDKKSKASADEEQPWLYHTQDAGVSKKKKVKPLSRRQHARLKRGRENAARNADVLEKKVEESVRRARKIKARRGEWETSGNVNGVFGKGLAVQAEQGEEDAEDVKEISRGNGKDGRTWTEKMVEVELEEAMDEIEGFALPTLGDEANGRNSVFGDIEPEGPTDTKDAPPSKVVDDVDEVT